MALKFPSIAAIAAELRGINEHTECFADDTGESVGCGVRLQVYPDGAWIVRSGDAQYDTDHRGFWGSSSVPGVVDGKVRRFNARATARDLIDQAREHAAQVEIGDRTA